MRVLERFWQRRHSFTLRARVALWCVVVFGVFYGVLFLIARPNQEVLLFAAPVAFLAAFCTGWLLAGYAVAPLKEVGRAVESIAPDRLEVRLPTTPGEPSETSVLKAQLNAALERLQRGYDAQNRFISNVA